MVISIDAEKSFNKIQDPFIIFKISHQIWNKGNIHQHNKGYIQQIHIYHHTQW